MLYCSMGMLSFEGRNITKPTQLEARSSSNTGNVGTAPGITASCDVSPQSSSFVGGCSRPPGGPLTAVLRSSLSRLFAARLLLVFLGRIHCRCCPPSLVLWASWLFVSLFAFPRLTHTESDLSGHVPWRAQNSCVVVPLDPFVAHLAIGCTRGTPPE